MNARFWTWESSRSGWVKITLRPGEALTRRTFSRDCEGWERTVCRWEHKGDHVRREYGSTGKDCDGTVSSGGADVCPLSRLQAVPPYMPGDETWRPEGRPDWQDAPEEEDWQRDETAELAGY